MASVLLRYTNLNSAVLKQEIRGGKEHVYLCLSVHARVYVCIRERLIEGERKRERGKKNADRCCRGNHLSLPSLL